jgi:hypothetical protein
VESTNKFIEAILTKTMREHHRDWTDIFHESLWAYQTTWRNTTGFSPYKLVYGKSHVFPIEFEIKTLRTTSTVNLDLTMVQKARMKQLNELDENHLDAIHQTSMIQQQRTKWHDQVIKKRLFQKGDWDLLYDSRFKEFQGKPRTRWLGPYEVYTLFPNGIVRLITIDGSDTQLHANGHCLCLYQCPLSKEEFKYRRSTDIGYQFLKGMELAPSLSQP